MRYIIVPLLFLTLFSTGKVYGECPSTVGKDLSRKEMIDVIDCLSKEIQDLKNSNSRSIQKEKEDVLLLLNDTRTKAEKIGAELDELLNKYQMEFEKISNITETKTLSQETRDMELNVTGMPLYVNNKCHHPISMLIKYELPHGIWVVKGWWNIKAKTEKFLMNRDKKLVVNSEDIYTYVESTDKSAIKWEGEIPVEYKGKIYNMSKEPVRISEDKYEIVMGCSYYD